MIVLVDKLDYFGRGIANTPKKVFIRDAHVGETLEIKTTKESKNFDEAEIVKIIEKSDDRIDTTCPYYPMCGGCDLRSFEYNDTIKYKQNNVKEILKDYINDDTLINIYKSKSYMRNKVTFKVKNKKIGFYQKKTHDLIEIKICFNLKPSINKVLPYLESLNIIDGEILVRSNYLDELLIYVKTKDKVNTSLIEKLPNIKGIIVNDKTIYKDNYFYDKVDDYIFKVTYNSFFQVNSYINGKIFNLLKMELDKEKTVLDLCSGVGTLSTLASTFSKKVYAIEISESNHLDALENKKINKIKNIDFILGDAFALMKSFKDVDIILIDPPRSGISKKGIESILEFNTKKIIYISCNPISLKRDLSYLKDEYKLKKLYILDMFPNTYHVESFCVLEKKAV